MCLATEDGLVRWRLVETALCEPCLRPRRNVAPRGSSFSPTPRDSAIASTLAIAVRVASHALVVFGSAGAHSVSMGPILGLGPSTPAKAAAGQLAITSSPGSPARDGAYCGGKWPKRRGFAASFPPTDRPAIRRELAMLVDSMLDYCEQRDSEMYAQDRGRVIAVAALVVSATPTAMRPAIAWPNRGRVKRATTPTGLSASALSCARDMCVPARDHRLPVAIARTHNTIRSACFRRCRRLPWPHPASPLPRSNVRKAWAAGGRVGGHEERTAVFKGQGGDIVGADPPRQSCGFHLVVGEQRPQDQVPARDFNVAHVGQGLTGDLSRFSPVTMAPQWAPVAQEIGHAHHHAPVQHHRQLGPAGGAQALLRSVKPASTTWTRLASGSVWRAKAMTLSLASLAGKTAASGR